MLIQILVILIRLEIFIGWIELGGVGVEKMKDLLQNFSETHHPTSGLVGDPSLKPLLRFL